eukprot:gene8713-659_t
MSVSEKDLTTFVRLQWKQGESIGFAELLKTLKTDWTDRVKAMNIFKNFIDNGATECSNFMSEFHYLKEPFCVQVLELRSAVVKEITALIAHIAITMEDSFEPLADYFLPVLLKNTYVTKKIISEPSHDCIKQIITKSKINKSINEIANSLSNKKSHKVLRQRSIEYINLLLQSKTTKYFENHVTTIEKAIKDAIEFDNKETGRKAFYEHQNHFPERSKKFLSSLDKKSQDYVNKDKNKTLSSSTTSSSIRSSQMSIRKKIAMNQQTTEKKVHFEMKEPPVTPLMKVPQRSILKSPKHQRVPETPVTPKQQLKPPLPFTDKSNKPNNVPITSITPLSKASPSPNRLTPSSLFSSSLKESQSPLSTFKFQYTKENEILTKLNDSNTDQWTTRVLLIEQLSSALEEGIDSKKMNFSKVMVKILDGLSDSHYRVVLETLNCLIKSIINYKSEFEEYLEKILSKLIIKTGDPKLSIRESSEQLIGIILNNFRDDKLLITILKLTQHQTVKIKMDCIEFLIKMIPKNKEFFSQQKNLREFVIVFSSNIKERKNTSSYVQCLTLLYQNYKQTFYEYLETISHSEQELLSKMLHPHLKLKDNDCPIGTTKSENETTPKKRNREYKNQQEGKLKLTPSSSKKLKSRKLNQTFEEELEELPTIKNLVVRESLISKDFDFNEFQKKMFEENDIHSLLNQLLISSELTDLNVLIKLCETKQGEWMKNAEIVQTISMSLTESDKDEIRSNSFLLIESIIRNYSSIYLNCQNELLSKLVKGNEDEYYKVRDSARNASNTFIDYFPFATDLLISNLENDYNLEVSLQLLHVILSKKSEKFLNIWKELTNCLLKFLKNEKTEIRESAVYYRIF